MPKVPDGKQSTVTDEQLAAFKTYAYLTGRKQTLIKARRRHAGVRALTDNIVSHKNICVLCTEDRALDKCHIFPVWWANCFDYESVEDLPHYLSDVMMMCPTHHRLYDKNKLNKNEVSILRQCFKDYKENLPNLLKRLQYVPAYSQKGAKLLDKFLDDVWVWWRTYYV